MIARQLTRIPYYGSSAEARMLEAFAFTYAAGYCNGSISNRMKESYQRAWDFDQWSFIPDITLGPPGGVIVRWEGDYRKKLVVALRGISSWSQLIPIRSGFGATPMPDYGGAVYAPFKTGADLMYSALVANPLFAEYYNDRSVPLVVTGHSMGAAIAEVLTAQFRREKPGKDIRLIKFASPRVGTRAWVQANTHSYDFQSVYIQPDPIINFPWQSVPQSNIGSGTPVPTWSNFVRDTFVTPYTYFGEVRGEYSYTAPTLARSLAALTSWPPPGDSVWYVHSPNAYRFALTALANTERGWWKWRFQYLEHTDEDRWGTDWRINLANWAPLVALGPAAPDDVVVDLPENEFKGYTRPRLAELQEQDLNFSGEGGTWSFPAAPSPRPIHHYPRP